MTEERLIEAVRGHRELYDTNDANYMKTKLKNMIWGDLAQELKLKCGEEAKTMWLKLRASYRDARRRQMKSLKSGVENIKPWRFQKQMSFLEPCMSAGLRDGNISAESDEDSQSQTTANDQILSSEGIQVSNIINEGRQKSNFEDTRGNDAESSSVHKFAAPHTSSSTQMAYSKPPKKIRKEDNIRDLIHRSMQSREDRARERAEERRALQAKSDDPLYNFFISMYQYTKAMPPSYQHRVKGQLFQAVSQAEEEIMNMSSRPFATLSLSSMRNTQHPSPETWSNSQHQFGTVDKAEYDINNHEHHN